MIYFMTNWPTLPALEEHSEDSQVGLTQSEEAVWQQRRSCSCGVSVWSRWETKLTLRG